jgi:hypothetical protein
VHFVDVVRDAYLRFDAKAAIYFVKDATWDSEGTKWNGNLHGERNAPKLEYSFPKYPQCESFDPIVFGRPNMQKSENKNPGFVTPEPRKPADYHPTVHFSAGDAMDMSDQEQYVTLFHQCIFVTS